jgi:hypothetical protein
MKLAEGAIVKGNKRTSWNHEVKYTTQAANIESKRVLNI